MQSYAKERYLCKGAIRVGSDAGTVLVDMNEKYVLRNKEFVSKPGWTPEVLQLGKPGRTLCYMGKGRDSLFDLTDVASPLTGSTEC